MLDIQINSLALDWNDVSYKAIPQTIDFVTSQFSFELLGLVLYPFFQIYVYYKLFFFLLELVPLNKISLIFQTCVLTNYNFQAKKKKKKKKIARNTNFLNKNWHRLYKLYVSLSTLIQFFSIILLTTTFCKNLKF